MRNVHVDWYTSQSEQDLLYDLVAEAAAFGGHDCYYLPRNPVDRDELLSEPEYSVFDEAYLVEFFLKTTAQMGGEGAMLSKFGVELRDELTVQVAMKTFASEVTSDRPDLVRPREGDLVYVGMIGALFTVKYVDKKSYFYQLGALQAWDLSLELYEDSSSQFRTGVPEIDDVYGRMSRDVYETALRTEDGHMLVDEERSWPVEFEEERTVDDGSQNVDFEDAGDELIEWEEGDPFSSGRY